MPIAKLTTGIRGFDMLAHGGIPEGRSTLVVGRSGAGKTIFGLQLASHFATNDVATLVVGVEESGEDLLVTGDGYRAAGSILGAAGLPAVVVQEGGYHQPTHGGLVAAYLDGHARATV